MPAPFDVREFGARGNGTADDTQAFVASLAAAAGVRGIVLVPSGTYRVAPMMRIASGVTMRGEGLSSVLRCTDGPGDRIVLLTVDTQNVVVEDLSLEGRFAHGILLERSNTARVSRCSVRGAVVPRGGYSSGVFIVGSDDVLIERSRFSGNGGSGPQQGCDIQCDGLGARSRRIRLEYNECASTDASFNLRCHNISDSTIRGNRVSGARVNGAPNHGYGILVYETPSNPGSCFNNEIVENRVSQTGGSGIYLVKSANSRIWRNVLNSVALVQTDDLLPVAAIALNEARGCNVTENVIENSGSAGISLASSVAGVGHGDVSRNSISSVVGVGIALRGTLEDLRISGNTISHAPAGISGGAQGDQAGVEITDNILRSVRDGITLGNARRAFVDGNTLRDCAGYAMDLTFRDSASTVGINTVTDLAGARDNRPGNVRVARRIGGAR